MRSHRRYALLAPLVAVCVLASCDKSPPAPPPAPAVQTPAPPAVPADVPAAETLRPAPEPVAPPVPEPVAVDDDPPPLAALRRDMPADVSDFIRRAVVCNHWAGEEPYDEDRRTQIAAAVESLRCRALDADQTALRAQYAGNAEVLRRINQSRRTPL